MEIDIEVSKDKVNDVVKLLMDPDTNLKVTHYLPLNDRNNYVLKTPIPPELWQYVMDASDLPPDTDLEFTDTGFMASKKYDINEILNRLKSAIKTIRKEYKIKINGRSLQNWWTKIKGGLVEFVTEEKVKLTPSEQRTLNELKKIKEVRVIGEPVLVDGAKTVVVELEGEKVNIAIGGPISTEQFEPMSIGGRVWYVKKSPALDRIKAKRREREKVERPSPTLFEERLETTEELPDRKLTKEEMLRILREEVESMRRKGIL